MVFDPDMPANARLKTRRHDACEMVTAAARCEADEEGNGFVGKALRPGVERNDRWRQERGYADGAQRQQRAAPGQIWKHLFDIYICAGWLSCAGYPQSAAGA